MRRYVILVLAAAALFIFIGLRFFAPTDPGVTQLEQAKEANTLIVIIHGLPGYSSLAALKRVVRADFPQADIMTATYSPSPLANIDPYRVANLIELGIHDAYEAKRYKQIILVGHSMGAVLVRKALVWALGAEDDRKVRRGPRAWPEHVGRFISLAGINRGVSLSERPANMSLPRYAFVYVGAWFGKLTGTASLLLSMERGSPFVADLRVQWIRIARQTSTSGRTTKLPLSIHLLGDIDDVVSSSDSQDLAAVKDTKFITLSNTGHGNIITELETGVDTDRRLRAIRAALSQPADKLEFDTLRVQDEDLSINKLIYILHGIRDYGLWADQLRTEIDKAKPANAVVTPPKYGYFPMMPFVLSWDRQKNVRRFMDEYTENLAKFPQATQLDFIGHSNGTYILASALQRYPTLKANNVVFAGSVVPKRYPWLALIADGRVAKVYNIVATGDWVVAIFPRFFEQIAEWIGHTGLDGAFDIGSAGFRGFDDSGRPDPQRRVIDAKFVSGSHGSALDLQDPAKMRALVHFAVTGYDEQLMALANSKSQNALLDVVSNISWVVWVLLLCLLVGLGYGIFLMWRWRGIALYTAILIGLLYSF